MLYGYHIWTDIPLIQGKDYDDLHHPKVIRGQIVNHAIWLSDFRRVYMAVYLSKGNTFQKLTGKNGHVDTLVGYNFQKEKSLPASFKPQEILSSMLTFWKLDPV